jgi:hypothetical protein
MNILTKFQILQIKETLYWGSLYSLFPAMRRSSDAARQSASKAGKIFFKLLKKGSALFFPGQVKVQCENERLGGGGCTEGGKNVIPTITSFRTL